MRLPKRPLTVVVAVLLIVLVGGVAWWFFKGGSRATVLKDQTGDVTTPDGADAAIDFIDLESLAIKVSGQNLILRYKLNGALPKNATNLSEVNGAKIATLQIWTSLESEKIPGKMAMLLNRWGTRGTAFSSNIEYGINPTPGGGPGSFQIQKKTKLLSGGLGYDYFEIAYPLSELNLTREDVVSVRVFAIVIDSNNQTISEDIIDDADFKIQDEIIKGALMDVRLGSSTPPPR